MTTWQVFSREYMGAKGWALVHLGIYRCKVYEHLLHVHAQIQRASLHSCSKLPLKATGSPMLRLAFDTPFGVEDRAASIPRSS